MDTKSGIVLLEKEAGMTSHTAVRRLARLFGVEKAGHTGTLDPMATGVLPVLIGRGVKASEYLTEGDKHYIATLRLGLTTDTEDITGTTLRVSDRLPDEAEVLAALQAYAPQHLAADEEMKKSPVRKRESFLLEMSIMPGIRKTSVRRCGNYIIPRFRNIRK